MRAAFVCLDPGVPVFGCKGNSVHCQEVIRALIHLGWSVQIFAVRFDDDKPDDLARIPCVRLDPQIGINRSNREQALVDLNSRIANALQLAGPFDLIYERYSLWSHAPMGFAQSTGSHGILEVNSPLLDEQSRYRTLENAELAQQLSNKAMMAAESIIAVSTEVAAQLDHDPVVQKKITVVPNGVNVSRFTGRNYDGDSRSTQTITLGFVGTLKPWHGVENLLLVFERLYPKIPGLQLKIIGDGPQKKQLGKLVATFSVETRSAITWTGAVSSENIPCHLSTVDIAVAPYPALESFYFSPLKVLEYMAAGLPIIASRIGQIEELIEHRQTGILVQPGCLDELEASIGQLCADHRQRVRLGRAARQRAVLDYSWETTVRKILGTIRTDSFVDCQGI